MVGLGSVWVNFIAFSGGPGISSSSAVEVTSSACSIAPSVGIEGGGVSLIVFLRFWLPPATVSLRIDAVFWDGPTAEPEPFGKGPSGFSEGIGGSNFFGVSKALVLANGHGIRC